MKYFNGCYHHSYIQKAKEASSQRDLAKAWSLLSSKRNFYG